MQRFDLERLSDPSVRREYDVLLRRAEAVASSAMRAYGADRLPITCHFVEADIFNARVHRTAEAYAIEINNAVPLLMMILFGAMLSHADMLPYLESSGALATNEVLPTIADPLDFDKRATWDVALTKERSFAALTLADMCSFFIFCHEIGHVVAGHADALHAIEGEDEIAELVSIARETKITGDVRQAWELDADAVAATLLMSFIEELLHFRASRQELDALLGDAKTTLPNLLAIVVAALFAFFCYVTGARDRLDLKSSHPHPLVRAHYLHDMILSAASANWTVDREAFEECFDDRFDEAMRVLERMKLLPGRAFQEGFGDQVAEELGWQIRNQKRVRSEFASWSWVDWG